MQLKRSQTMKRASEFAMVRNEGTSEAGRFLILSTAPLPGGEDEDSRFGIITTKRIGHAVLRNTLRRRVREILRAHGESISKGMYVVIVVRNRAAMTDYSGLEKDFLKLLRRRTTENKQPC
ncbi:MAG: ribonuclease P protein component [Akkermansia sp.]|nr:ribonuclease P protein component [Akkermansia sp.]